MNNCQWQHKSQSEISPQKTVVIRNPRGQFRSHDKDGNHSIRSAIAKNPTLTSWLYVLQNRSYCRCKFYIARIGILDLFCFCEFDLDLMTFICKLRPVYHGDISDVQIWTSHVKAFESYRLTDREADMTVIIYLRGWSKITYSSVEVWRQRSALHTVFTMSRYLLYDAAKYCVKQTVRWMADRTDTTVRSSWLSRL